MTDVSMDSALLLKAAADLNEQLDSALPPDEFRGQETVLVMALISRVGVCSAKRLLGCPN